MRAVGAALVFIAMGISAPAVAAELPLKGSWGDEAGCRNLKTGEHVGDDLLALTATEVKTYATLCSYVTVTPVGNGSFVATVICGHEGEAEQTLGLMRFDRSDDGERWGIFSSDGSTWGEVGQCR